MNWMHPNDLNIYPSDPRHFLERSERTRLEQRVSELESALRSIRGVATTPTAGHDQHPGMKTIAHVIRELGL